MSRPLFCSLRLSRLTTRPAPLQRQTRLPPKCLNQATNQDDPCGHPLSMLTTHPHDIHRISRPRSYTPALRSGAALDVPGSRVNRSHTCLSTHSQEPDLQPGCQDNMHRARRDHARLIILVCRPKERDRRGGRLFDEPRIELPSPR